ncbi:MAG: ATP-binding protein [Opitutaceae bacterium]
MSGWRPAVVFKRKNSSMVHPSLTFAASTTAARRRTSAPQPDHAGAIWWRRDAHRQVFSRLLRHLPIIVGRVDSDGRIVEAAAGAQVQRRCNLAQLKGERLSELFPRGRAAVERAISGADAGFAADFPGRDGEVCSFEFHVFFDARLGRGAHFFGRDITARRSLEKQLLDSVDLERRRIGADLHDDIGQLLTGITFLGKVLAEKIRAGDPGAFADAEAITSIAKDALVRTRDIARGLSSMRVQQIGLEAALLDLCRQVRRVKDVECALELSSDALCHPAEVATHLFHIAQEAVSNAIRHGGASRIAIVLEAGDGRHVLSIIDNGSGFDPAAPSADGGAGLCLMQYRAALIGGVINLTSQPGLGTKVVCSHFPSYAHDINSNGQQQPATL